MKPILIFPLLLLCQTVLCQTFTGVNPKPEEYIQPGSPTFEWNDNGSSSYTLEISTNSNFSNILLAENTNNNQHTISIVLSSGIYFWRVNDGSQFSPTYKLNVFLPSDDSDIRLWLDPSTGIVMDGMGNISSWSDSGSGLSFTQNNSIKQPLFEPSGFSDLPEIKFNGGQVLDGGDVLDLYLNSHAFYLIGNASGNDQSFFAKSIAAGQQNRYSLLNLAGSTTFLYHDNNVRNLSLNNLITGNAFFNLRVNQSTDEISLSVNNSIPSANTFNSTHNMDSPFRFLIGAYNANPDNSEILYLNGGISEIIITNNVTQTSTKNIKGYLKYKYMPKLDLGFDITQYGYCDTTLRAGNRFESYLWQDGSTADSLVVTESGTYWVEVVDIFGFTSTDTIQVIFPEPDMPSNQLYCPGDSTTWYTNLGPNYNYLWSDGSTADTLSINAPGDYHVQITDTNGCVFQSDTLYFDADPFETIVDLGPDVNLCSGNSIGLVAGDTEAVSYLWNTGNTDSTINVNTTGTYYLDVINANGCEASDTIDVTIIGDAPTVIPGVSTTVCQNEVFSYQDQSTTSDGSNIISWDWDFGDGGLATSEQGNYSYANNGVFNVSLTVETSAGCFNDTTVSITVLEQPVLDFTTVNDCQETVINFNGGQLTPTTINTWEWNFDDPTSGLDNEGSGQNTTHIFESADNFDVQLIGTDVNGCKDTVVQTVTIESAPQVDFAFDEVCEGDLIEFENLSTIDTTSSISGYEWSFGDGTFSGQAEPQKLYSNSGTFSVTLEVTGNNGCSGQLTQPLKIHAFPIIDQGINSSCAGITSIFNDSSFVPGGSIAEVYWSLNGASALNGFSVSHTFENSGSQSIDQTVVSAFGCSSTESYTIQIDDYISADFEIEPTALLAGYPTSFNNLSIGALSNEWIFGNLGTSTDVNPDFTFPETAVGDDVTIELKVENSFSCRDSVSLTLPVLSPRTDLAIAQLFLQEDNGFYVVGVELENKGTTPITSSDLFLRTPSTDVIKEVWEGELQAGEKEIYIFSASPSMTVPQSQMDQNYVCVETQIKTPLQFKDEDLSNNDNCQAVSESSGVLIVPHPNPVENDLNIQLVLPFDEVGTLKIYNAQGQIVAVVKEEANFKKGLNSYKVNTELWQSGNYSIVYNGESEQQVAKVIKL